MPVLIRDEETILSEARSWLRANTQFTNFSGSSLVWNLVEIQARELAMAWQAMAEIERQQYLESATGDYLTALGLMFGLARRSFQPANTLGMPGGFKFYVIDGLTWGEVGSGNAILPAGTLVWSSRDSRKLYQTLQEAEFTSSVREVFVPISALDSGSAYNVGPGQLDRHNASEFQNLILCTNLHPIDTGTDLEDDESYRYRLSQQIYRLLGLSQPAIQAAAMSVPGVRDVIVHEFARGAGTIDLTVLTYLPRASESVLESVRQAIEQVRPEGIDVQVQGPIERAIDLTVQLIPNDLNSELKWQAQQVAASYLNRLGLGQPFIVNELIQRLMEVSELIQDLALLELWVTDRSGQRTPSLFVNQQAAPDEKFYAGRISVV